MGVNLSDVFKSEQAVGGLVAFLAQQIGKAEVTRNDPLGIVIDLTHADGALSYVQIRADGTILAMGRGYNRNQAQIDSVRKLTQEYVEAVAPLATRERLVATVKGKGRVQSDITDQRTQVRVITLSL